MEATRLLAFGGIAFLVCGMLAGEIYAIYISHVANGVIGRNWQGVISAVAGGDVDAVMQHFAVIGELTEKRGRVMNTHSHVGAYGLLALLLAHLQPYLALGSESRRLLAWLFLAGAVLQFGGVYLSYYAGDWLFYLANAGAILLIFACARMLLALRAPSNDAASLENQLEAQLAPAASRFLLKAGLLLIIGGMAFGLYYAWVLVSQDEPALYEAVNDATTLVAADDVAGAERSITAFKRGQSKIAITAAAHSHAVEFGFLMLLLALLQRYVLLQDHWRLNWARVMATGAYLLPLCVFLATKYGLRAAAFADLSGALVLVALIAMGFGVARYTGAADSETQRVAS